MDTYQEERPHHNNRSSSGLSIAGMVLGIISLLISFVPCIGTMALIPAIIGLILSILGYKKDKEILAPTTMGLAGIILCSLAIVLSGLQSIALGSMGNSVANEMKVDVDNCDDLLIQMQKVASQFEAIKDKNEDDVKISDFTNLVKLTSRIGAFNNKAQELGCTEDPDFVAKKEAITSRVNEDE